MAVQVVFVHGIRTSATMWRAQLEYLRDRGVAAVAVDLPGHGTRLGETFALEGAFVTIDRAVREAADAGPVLLVGHSMGGLLCTAYVGDENRPPVDALIAASCTAIPRGVGLGAYRALARGFNRLPGRGQWFTDRVLAGTLPLETRQDFGAGGYAYDAQDAALTSLSILDLLAALRRIDVPTWFINGQYDQLRVNEKLFVSQVPDSELFVVPRTTHLVTAMRPQVFNALLGVAIATLDSAQR
ncbi:alpha/beta fold hydrolase [Microbacterium invictum]|uniref:Pimeloyl-ACP methyl ester carboxylesterase n=1 Tax=Microbacterium invictum TaxID=515415 RepID=A0AA40SMQ0_9MICO|nr:MULTISPECIES: alpha/beta hydrolase [Microbacterium]MBB4139061.1 pimeloyl-ACP methyl ester carboxylesterase [Microbacterium invictum]